jgi:uncharacterized surface protein with fasciclin (FAS1) repeats
MDGEFPVDFGDGFFHRKLQYKGRICDTNVIDVAREDMTLSTFVELVTLAGLEDLFLCAGPFTALIPNNDAFDALDPDFLASLRDPANQKMLEQLLLYHLLPGAFFSADFKDGPQVTLQGENVAVEVDPLRFNGANVLEPDITACNGVIHVVDEVLAPPSFGKLPSNSSGHWCTFLSYIFLF